MLVVGNRRYKKQYVIRLTFLIWFISNSNDVTCAATVSEATTYDGIEICLLLLLLCLHLMTCVICRITELARGDGATWLRCWNSSMHRNAERWNGKNTSVIYARWNMPFLTSTESFRQLMELLQTGRKRHRSASVLIHVYVIMWPFLRRPHFIGLHE